MCSNFEWKNRWLQFIHKALITQNTSNQQNMFCASNKKKIHVTGQKGSSCRTHKTDHKKDCLSNTLYIFKLAI